MARVSRPPYFRAEGQTLNWRAISDRQNEGRQLPADLERERKRAVSGRGSEVHLRWACVPSIGVPMTPFEVWMRRVDSQAEDTDVQFTSEGNALRATLPQAASLVRIELQSSNLNAPVAVFGLRKQGDTQSGLPRQGDLRPTIAAQSHHASTPDRFTLTLRGDGITDLLIENGANPRVAIQRIDDTINDPQWKRIEIVGLPVDGTWGNSAYSHADQGVSDAEAEPMKAAIQRLARGIPPIGWPMLTQGSRIAPPWETVVPEQLIEELHKDLMPMLERCFNGVLSSEQLSIRPVMNVDPPQQDGRRSSATTTAALAPIQLLLLSATTEPALALACGFGTAFSLESSGIEGLSTGKVDFMVSGSWKGDPELGDVELASYIPWPETHERLTRPIGLTADRDGLVRPQVTDAPWRESVRVRWNRVADTAALGRPTTCAFSRYDSTTIPNTLSLMPQRQSGGWRTFVLSVDGKDGELYADKNALVDAAVELPLNGSSRPLGYAVAVQDVFGVWSAWADALHQDAAPAAPGLGLISVQLDTRYSGSASTCPSGIDMQIAIDWSSRRPNTFELFMGFYPMADADSPAPSTLAPGSPVPSGMFRRELTVTFNGDTADSPLVQPLDAEGLEIATAGAAQGTNTRRYRIQLPVPELDFSNTRRWGVRIWGRLESRIVPGFSPWGPPDGTSGIAPAVSVAVAASPVPIMPMPLPQLPGVPMGSQPDGSGRSHVNVYWSLPSGIRPQKINVWEITESVIRERESLAQPEVSTLPGSRLVELRNAYDAQPQDQRRLGFRRLLELPGTAREVDIAMPKGSTDIHFYTITTTTDTGVESPWPTGTAQQRLHAFIAPRLITPSAPFVRSTGEAGGVSSLDLSTTSAIEVREFKIYRSLSTDASRRIGSMGPPFAIVNASLSTEPDANTGLTVWQATWSGAFAASWDDWLVRAVAVPVPSVADAGIRGQVSLPSDVIFLAVRPDAAPDLAPLTHDDFGSTHTGVLVRSSTSLRFPRTTAGTHRMIMAIDGVVQVIDDINRIPVSESAVPSGARPGPVLVRGVRLSGQTPLTIAFERDNREKEVDVTLKLIDPRGRVTSQSMVVPPWIDQQLPVKIQDVFSISGRGFVLTFSADAPVDSRVPGELTITLNPSRFSNSLRPDESVSIALHKVAFAERPDLSAGTAVITVNRTSKRTPYTYSVFIRTATEPTVVVSIKMRDGRTGTARHSPRVVISPGRVNPFDPPIVLIPPRR